MDNKSVQNNQIQQQNAQNEMGIKDIVFMCLSNWGWFLASVVVCVSLAVAYLLVTPKVYTRYASIALKDENKGRSIRTNMQDAFKDLGVTAPNSNLHDELHSITSRDLALKAAERLSLNVDYSVDGRYHAQTIYGEQLPIKITFPGMEDDEYVEFDVNLSKNGNVVLKNFKNRGEEVQGEAKGKVGFNMIHTPVGRVVVNQSPYFKKFKFGKTIHVTRIPLAAAKAILFNNFDAQLADKESNVIELVYQDVSPKRAEDVLSTIIAIYNENWVSDRNQIAVSTSEFIDERLRVIEKELGSVDNDISSYKSTHQITDLQAVSAMYLQRSNQSDTKVLDLSNQVYIAKYIRSYLTNKANENQVLPANLGISNTTITSQISNYNQKLIQRNNIVANGSEANPVAVELAEQLAALRASIISSIDNELVSLNNALQTQRGFGNEAISKITSNPQQAKYLLSVERQQKVKESLYLFLLQKREENELSQAFTAYNTRIIEVPQGSNRPTAPITRNILLIALALGLAIPFGILYLLETLNSTVRGKADLDGKLSIPYLGEIPMYMGNMPKKWYEFWKKKKEPRKFVVRNGSRGVINEAFRLVGTNMELMVTKGEEKSNVYMVTSYNPGSGKSFISGNLGATLSMKRKKVLLIDGDLRHASTSTFVNSPKKGLSELLRGVEENVQSVIVPVEQFSNLYVLPVGTIPPNPTELLSSGNMEKILNELRSMYDFIIIDCPPADMMADATIVEKYVDRTLFVIRAGLLERRMISDLELAYTENKFKNISYILNGTKMIGKLGNKYGYKYGYKYGANYGYGDKKDAFEE